jgi:quinol monooxygenase YgiN
MPKREKTQVVCVAEWRAFEGKTEELVAALHSLIEATLKEAGCLRYELNQRADDSRWVTFIEKWKDREAFDRHCATPPIKHYYDVIRPQLVEQFEVKLYEEVLP